MGCRFLLVAPYLYDVNCIFVSLTCHLDRLQWPQFTLCCRHAMARVQLTSPQCQVLATEHDTGFRNKDTALSVWYRPIGLSSLQRVSWTLQSRAAETICITAETTW